MYPDHSLSAPRRALNYLSFAASTTTLGPFLSGPADVIWVYMGPKDQAPPFTEWEWTLQPAEQWKLTKSQSGLLEKKGAIWGRSMALRMLGLPVTRFAGLDLWHSWKQLTMEDKLRSTLGTVRRVLTRKLYRPMKLSPSDGVLVKPQLMGMASKAP